MIPFHGVEISEGPGAYEEFPIYQMSYLTLLVTASLLNLHKSISSPLFLWYNLKQPLTRSTRSWGFLFNSDQLCKDGRVGDGDLFPTADS